MPRSAGLAAYRRVLSVPGGAAFSMAGLLGRMPISMVSLGIVILVEYTTGSYALGGTTSAAYVLANAVLAVAHGRAMDRWGQSRVLPLAIVVHAVAMSGLMLLATADAPAALLLPVAVLAGGALPQCGSSVRARWSHVLDSSRDVQTAYALESVVDETVFVTGPVIVTMLATAWHPMAGLVVATACGLVGTLWLSSQRRTEPPAHPPDPQTRRRPPMPWRVVIPLLVVSLAMGALFGGSEVAAVSFAEDEGAQQYAGAALAIFSFGSLLAGVITGLISWRAGPLVRLRWSLVLLTLGALPLAFVGSLPVMLPLMFLTGMGVAPGLISCNAMIEQAVPRARLTEGMALLHTAMGAGVAPGAALAGVVADSVGGARPFVVCAAGAALAMATAWVTPNAGPAPGR